MQDATNLMPSILDCATEIYVFVDDYLKAHPKIAHWRTSNNDQPQFTDAEVITLGLMQGALGVPTLKKTHQMIRDNIGEAFPLMCSYSQWLSRLHALTALVGHLVEGVFRQMPLLDHLYLVDAKPIPVCKPIRHGRVRLLRDDGAYFGKTSAGWFFGFKLHVLVHHSGPVLSAMLTPGNHDDRPAGQALARMTNGGVLTNGDITLRIESGYHPETNRLLGVPGGGTARLLMHHITTQVVVRRSRHIHLGETITALLGKLGFHRAGDRYREVRDQLLRLAFARISYIDRRRNLGQHTQFVIRQSLVTDTVHFWEAERVQRSMGPSEYGGTLHLTRAFFEELLSGCVPVDPRVLVYFRRSPLTMDLYVWLTYKCAYMERCGRTEIQVSWQQLHEQFPANYQCTKQFAHRVRKALLEIKGIWPTLWYETPRGRLVLKKTRSHVARA